MILAEKIRDSVTIKVSENFKNPVSIATLCHAKKIYTVRGVRA
jgi:hypothetical protein